MTKQSKSALKKLHTAIQRGDVQGHLLAPHLSTKDMGILKQHLDKGTLMKGLTTVADAPSRAAAVRELPKDLGAVIAKLPATTVRDFSSHLNTLSRDDRGIIGCDC